jgi:hypothetical protein
MCKKKYNNDIEYPIIDGMIIQKPKKNWIYYLTFQFLCCKKNNNILYEYDY